MDLIDTFRAFHPNAVECTFFSSAHEAFSRIDHILGHKSNLSKFQKIEIVSSIFSSHNTMSSSVVLVTQSCPTLCDLMDCGPPGSSAHGILQGRILEWMPIPFSRVIIIIISSSVSHSVVSNSLRPAALWPTRLFCPWDSPGKNTGVDCHLDQISITRKNCKKHKHMDIKIHF